jgi:preprotein translocase subunit SecF
MAGRTASIPIDLMGKSKLWLTIGSIVMLLGIIGMIPPEWTGGLTPGRLNFGLDFTGGAEFTYKLPKKVAVGFAAERRLSANIRSQLAKAGLRNVVIQISEGDVVIIRTQARDEEQSKEHEKLVDDVMNRMFKGVEKESTEVIGPVIGRELKVNATKATILGLLGILVYIWVRYDVLFAIAAIVALIHDVLAVLAFASFTHITINSPFVAVLLTIVGYSVNDTVVIFDRIRENMKRYKDWAFIDVANFSIIETMARSINTVLTTEFPLWAILLYGGMAAKDFALPLLVGITSGAYSSIFIASPLVLVMRELLGKEARKVRVTRPAVAVEKAQSATASGPTKEPTLPSTETATSQPSQEEVKVSVPSSTTATLSAVQHAKKRKRKKKRRH